MRCYIRPLPSSGVFELNSDFDKRWSRWSEREEESSKWETSSSSVRSLEYTSTSSLGVPGPVLLPSPISSSKLTLKSHSSGKSLLTWTLSLDSPPVRPELITLTEASPPTALPLYLCYNCLRVCLRWLLGCEQSECSN